MVTSSESQALGRPDDKAASVQQHLSGVRGIDDQGLRRRISAEPRAAIVNDANLAARHRNDVLCGRQDDRTGNVEVREVVQCAAQPRRGARSRAQGSVPCDRRDRQVTPRRQTDQRKTRVIGQHATVGKEQPVVLRTGQRSDRGLAPVHAVGEDQAGRLDLDLIVGPRTREINLIGATV